MALASKVQALALKVDCDLDYVTVGCTQMQTLSVIVSKLLSLPSLLRSVSRSDSFYSITLLLS